MGLAKKIYTLTNSFPKEERYGLTSQMRRSVVSIPANIAEGAARKSNKEFIQFLYISLGSLSELETQLLLSKEFNYFNDSLIFEELDFIKKPLIGLIKHLQAKNEK